ncbi:hypothetical protein [Anabaena sp. PCC 7108]|uniref:hypothetical protein n=1 Tax=Anabaena sp. PCC 7108 TaxID=163908 RepID=UPI0003466CAA|nr:hypothetical protein [Anabaena sp. PCC 7108]
MSTVINHLISHLISELRGNGSSFFKQQLAELDIIPTSSRSLLIIDYTGITDRWQRTTD